MSSDISSGSLPKRSGTSGLTKTAILHIGTWKTGSTSIQRWLVDAKERGTLAPVCYPLWGRDYNHQRLVALYRPYGGLPPAMLQNYGPGGKSYRRMQERYRDHIFGELRTASAAVLSGESLWVLLSPLQAAQLRGDLESVGFRKFHVVIYIRDPADFYLSLTQQRLKSIGTKPFVGDPATFRYEFLQMAEAWERAFPGRLIVRKYSSQQDTDVIDDFAAVLQRFLGYAPPTVPLRVNTTLSAEAMYILEAYRDYFSPNNSGQWTPDAAKIARILSEPAPGLNQTKPALKNDVAEQIRANHEADVEILLARYGVDLSVGNRSQSAALPSGNAYGVEDILESVDPEVVRHLLLRIAHVSADRGPLSRLASRVYRNIPPVCRPERLAEWLRSQL